MTQRSVDRDGSAFHISHVLHGGSKNVTILPFEQVSDSHRGELMLVAGFISEQDTFSDVGCLALFFPNQEEVGSREFLCQEGAK